MKRIATEFLRLRTQILRFRSIRNTERFYLPIRHGIHFFFLGNFLGISLCNIRS